MYIFGTWDEKKKKKALLWFQLLKMYLLVVGCFRTYLPTPDNELPSLAL